MAPIFSSTRDFLGFVVEALFIIVAIAAVWLFYRYVRSALAQNRLAAVRQLAEAAIDYVEDLDRRGDLNVPAGTDKGAWKRQLAAQWLKTEMQSDGDRMAPEQAHGWVAASSNWKPQLRARTMQCTGTWRRSSITWTRID